MSTHRATRSAQSKDMARAISMTMLRCDGDGLPTTLAAGNYIAQVFGCAAGSAYAAPLTFVLAVLRRGDHVHTNCGNCSGYAQQPLSTWHSAPDFALDGQHCSVTVLQSAVTLKCPLNRAKYRFGGFRVMLSMHTLSTQGVARGGAVLSVSDAIPPPTTRLHCSSVPIFGTHSFLVGRLAAVRSAWAANGFNQTLIFAHDRKHCDALTSATTGVVCEVRMPFASIVSKETGQVWGSIVRQRHDENKSAYMEETSRYLEQPLLSNLCLVYAQAGASELLATTDLDEPPPPNLMPALHTREANASAQAPFAGVCIFFDATRSCPHGFCPDSFSGYRQHCLSNYQERRHCKPIVVPNRVRELRTHAFVRMNGSVAKVMMWSPCLQHV